MPGIAWLAMHPPKADLFPWWMDYALNAATGIMCLIGVWMLGVIATDIWRDWKR